MKEPLTVADTAEPHLAENGYYRTSDGFVQKKNFISIKRAKKCLFARRNGEVGLLLFGLSIRIRLFSLDLI